MSDIFQIASIGMLQGRQRLEAISLNAASASLPGYRRHISVGRAFDSALAGPAAASGAAPAAAGSPAATRSGVTGVDLRPGAMTQTHRALDVAIEGDDLFFALTDGTQTWLTRAGTFHVGETGFLEGERGLHVVGSEGDIHLPSVEVQIGGDGRITSQGAVVATLPLFRPNDRSTLQAASGSLLTAPDGIQPAESGVGRVRSGMLEASNTDSAREMLGVVEISRQFESLSHVIQGYDELLGRVIEKLGEV